ncbi:LPS assembly lipoprotein LptE [uncultured Thiodictyon sp.]|uniref:LPS-assembly lipoprotein LptE n=1 Tax=uncultured Thiodictyon sp. TaxID=1846217 RepID=UPI0025E5AC85|nr:LPS assembly lipoprotein LptE [uncultured Thiodictyon sp.]
MSVNRVQSRRAALRALLQALSLLPLASCGFHLRGALAVPAALTPLYVQGGAGSPVFQAIQEQLSGSTVPVATSPSKAKLILRILGEGRTSRVVATNSAGKVLAYELHYLVTYDAVLADGKEWLPRQRLDLVRTFDNPDVEVLGKQLEEVQIYQEFAIDAADRILMRLRTALH